MNTTLPLCALLVGCTTTTVHGVRAHTYLPPQNQDGLVLYSAGMDKLLVDPKDERLARALAMVDERIAELPGELGEEIPVPLIQLGLDVLTSPMHLRAGIVTQNGDPAAGPPIYGQLTLTGAGARDLGARISQAMQMMGMPDSGQTDAHGLAQLDLGGMTGHMGDLSIGGDEAWVFAAGEPLTDELQLGTLDLPQGVEPVLAYKWDMGQYFEGLEMFLHMAGESTEGIDIVRMFASEGVIVGGYGHGADRSFWTMRYTDYVPYARQLGVMPDTPLRMPTLRAVPEDATYAALGSVDLSGFPGMLRGMLQSVGEELDMGEDPYETIYALTGVHVERDLFDHLGQAYGMYMSDSTGGGGWGSLILFSEVSDADKLTQTLDELAQRGGQIAKMETEGYVQVRKHETEHRSLTSLAFPGLPIPLELTYGITATHMFLGLSPQSVSTAMDQATSGSTSLLDNQRFAEFASGKLEGLYGVSFTDTPRMIRDGYTLTSLLGSALSNATSSPADPSRYVGSIVPPYNELVKGAKASVGLTRIEGGDMVALYQGDRSMLVNMAGSLGLVSDLVLPAVGLLGVTTTRNVQSSLSDARYAKAEVDIAAIEQALLSYAINNGGEYPDTLNALTVPDENGNAYLDGASLYDPWGVPYVYEPPSSQNAEPRVYRQGR